MSAGAPGPPGPPGVPGPPGERGFRGVPGPGRHGRRSGRGGGRRGEEEEEIEDEEEEDDYVEDLLGNDGAMFGQLLYYDLCHQWFAFPGKHHNQKIVKRSNIIYSNIYRNNKPSMTQIVAVVIIIEQ